MLKQIIAALLAFLLLCGVGVGINQLIDFMPSYVEPTEATKPSAEPNDTEPDTGGETSDTDTTPVTGEDESADTDAPSDTDEPEESGKPQEPAETQKPVETDKPSVTDEPETKPNEEPDEILMWNEKKDILTHASFDQCLTAPGKIDGEDFFRPGQVGLWDYVANLPDFTIDYVKVSGWVGAKGRFGTFGYGINDQEPVFDSAFYGKPTTLIIEAANQTGADSAGIMSVYVPTKGLVGDNTVKILYRNAAGKITCITEFTLRLPSDTTLSFTSDLASQPIDTDFKHTDLADFFTLHLPTGNCKVEELNGEKVYAFTTINEMTAMMDGAYYVKVNCLDSNSNSAFIVRGYQAMNPDSLLAEKESGNAGVLAINNFFETDCNGLFGGAGIYLRTDGTNLHINIKTYNPHHFSRISNNQLTIPTTGSEITVVDTGARIAVMVDGETLVLMELEGSTIYDDIKAINCPMGNTFVSKMTLRRHGSDPLIFENTLVAASVHSQIGMAVRAGTFKFSSLSVGSASSIPTPPLQAPGEEPPSASPEPIRELQVDTPYHIYGYNANGPLFFNGEAMNGQLTATDTIDSATVVWLESTGVAGEYYLYFADGDQRVYIAALDESLAVSNDRSAAFGAFTERYNACIWLIDPISQTIVSRDLGDRGISTHLSDDLNVFCTYSTSSFGTDGYRASWLTAADTADVPPPPPESKRLRCDKTVYQYGEPIRITAEGETRDWVGIASKDEMICHGWYYISAVGSGSTVNFYEVAMINEGYILPLPPGEYVIYRVPDDMALLPVTFTDKIEIRIEA